MEKNIFFPGKKWKTEKNKNFPFHFFSVAGFPPYYNFNTYYGSLQSRCLILYKDHCPLKNQKCLSYN